MSTDIPSPPPSSPLTRPMKWAILVTGVCLLVVTAGLVDLLAPKPLPRLGALPAFTFTRQDEQPFGLEQLKGRPWVANFIFTRCPTVCPLFTRKMAQVQQQTAELGTQLPLVSFSVDPQHDTPERLTAYAAKYGADPTRWSFLTGDYTLLKETLIGGFKVAMGRESEDPNDIQGIFHGNHFVLVDRSGEIRGYYNSSDEEAVERLIRDAERLVRSGE